MSGSIGIYEIGKELLPKFQQSLENSGELEKSKHFTDLISWYDKTKQSKNAVPKNTLDTDIVDLALEVRKGKDAFLSKLANILAEKLVGRLDVPFIELTLDNIRIQTGEKPQAKINTTFNLDILKPYVEFIFKINGLPQNPPVKIDFLINSTVKISDTSISVEKDELFIEYGMLYASLTASVIDLGVGAIKVGKPIKLDEIKFEKNLTGYRFAKHRSKKCQKCHLTNPFIFNKCHNCDGTSFNKS